ncbi:hypothetical protein [Labilibacter marinus]|uniref:hypothetical protein n=1 Tax=Labilibacter marinus TaxID=1477105 RepID=UPI00094FBEEA|nr:hypothetical protein [Labilibacter marinus]
MVSWDGINLIIQRVESINLVTVFNESGQCIYENSPQEVIGISAKLANDKRLLVVLNFKFSDSKSYVLKA